MCMRMECCHSNVPDAILKGYSKYEGSVPKSSLECQLEHMQQNKEEPRNSFKVHLEEQQEITEKQQLDIRSRAGNKAKYVEFKRAAVGEKELAKRVGARTAEARRRLRNRRDLYEGYSSESCKVS